MPTKYPFWLGGVAASMAACCTHPLDLTKARMQTVRLTPTCNAPSTISTIRASISDAGVRSLFTGLSASLFRQMTYSLVRLGSYEAMKARLSEDGKKPRSSHLLMAAAFAGGLGGMAGNPADILLVRMTTDAIRPPEKQYRYRNAMAGLWSLVKEEGIQGLARGLGPNVTRAVLMNASQVGSYDLVKHKLLHHKLPFIDYEFRDNLVLHAVSSCFAGTVATTVCSPADVLKSRLMSTSSNHGMLHILTVSLRKEGPMFLFKGWTPAFIRLAPNTILLFVFFEQLKKGWTQISS